MKHPGNDTTSTALRAEPFVHRYYNVKEFDSASKFAQHNILAWMVNSLIQAMNENPSILPKYLVMIPDDQMIAVLRHTGFGVSLMMGKCVYWLIEQTLQIINNRKEALTRIKLGAVTPGEPRILWVRLLEKPGQDNFTVTKSKFDIILEQAVCQSNAGIVLTASDGICRHWFDVNNNFTHEGRISYWRHFSDQVKNLDFPQTVRRQHMDRGDVNHRESRADYLRRDHPQRRFLLPRLPSVHRRQERVPHRRH